MAPEAELIKTHKHVPLRIPIELYDDVKKLADGEERSVNQTLVRLVRAGMGERQK